MRLLALGVRRRGTYPHNVGENASFFRVYFNVGYVIVGSFNSMENITVLFLAIFSK